MINKKALFTSLNQDWTTPKEFYDKLNKEFDFDPCPISNYTNGGKVNGLECEWGKRNYCNPPYTTKEQNEFIDKGIEEWKKGKLVVFLIPSSTGTKRFEKLLNLKPQPKFRFIIGRLKFGNQKNYAPFDSVVVVLRDRSVRSGTTASVQEASP